MREKVKGREKERLKTPLERSCPALSLWFVPLFWDSQLSCCGIMVC